MEQDRVNKTRLRLEPFCIFSTKCIINQRQIYINILFYFSLEKNKIEFMDIFFSFLTVEVMSSYLQAVYATIDRAPTKNGKKRRKMKMVCI